MKKKFLGVMAVATMLCLAGCQSETGNDAPDATPTVEAVKEPEATATSTPTPEPTNTPTPTPAPLSEAFIKWQLIDEGVEIISLKVDIYSECVIPNEISGHPVVRIADKAFTDNDNLKYVVIPDSVTYIGEEAFYGCSNLTEVVLPADVQTFGYAPFDKTPWLDNLYNEKGLAIYEGMLLRAKNTVESVEIPDDVTHICNYAFAECESLKSVKLVSSVEILGAYAFAGCTNLQEVEIPEGVQHIYLGCFYKCSSLKSITFPASVTYIGRGAFCDCVSLTAVELPEGITTIYSQMFRNCKNLTSIKLPNSVTSIDNEAFLDCEKLINIELPEGLTKIGDVAFCGCSSLEDIALPGSLKSIGHTAFSECSALKNIALPNGLESIGEDAFLECKGLTEIEIPDSVVEIGWSAFKFDYGENIIIYTTPGSFAESWFKENESEYYLIGYDKNNPPTPSPTPTPIPTPSYNVVEGTYWIGRDTGSVLKLTDNKMYLDVEEECDYSISYDDSEYFAELDAGWYYGSVMENHSGTNRMSITMWGIIQDMPEIFYQVSEKVYTDAVNQTAVNEKNIIGTTWFAAREETIIEFKDGLATIEGYSEKHDSPYSFNEAGQLVIENFKYEKACTFEGDLSIMSAEFDGANCSIINITK